MVRKKKVQEKETKIKRIEKKKGVQQGRGGVRAEIRKEEKEEKEENGPEMGELDRFGSRKNKKTKPVQPLYKG